ncbi:hypothetical protein ABKN59_005710 [Abortiporus biennis]
MAKKNKDEVPNPNSVTNRDIIQRMNFLYQAGALLSNIGASTSHQADGNAVHNRPLPHVADQSLPLTKREQKRSGQRRAKHPSSLSDLSKSYIQTMKIVGQRTTVRMDPAVKRTLCKQCNNILMPGVTCSVRVKALSSHGNGVAYTCLSCNKIRRIPAPPYNEDVNIISDPSSVSASNPSNANAIGSDFGASETHTMILDGPISMENPKEHSVRQHHRRRKKSPLPRVPPLFERKVGHVIFRGSDRLEDDDATW